MTEFVFREHIESENFQSSALHFNSIPISMVIIMVIFMIKVTVIIKVMVIIKVAVIIIMVLMIKIVVMIKVVTIIIGVVIRILRSVAGINCTT